MVCFWLITLFQISCLSNHTAGFYDKTFNKKFHDTKVQLFCIVTKNCSEYHFCYNAKYLTETQKNLVEKLFRYSLPGLVRQSHILLSVQAAAEIYGCIMQNLG